MKICSTALVIMEMQIKTIMSNHYYYYLERLKLEKLPSHTTCWWQCEETGFFTHCWWEFKLVCECVSAQLCLTLCNPMDWGLQGSSVHGIFQARILEWVAISFSKGSRGIEPRSPALQADSLPSEPLGKTNETVYSYKDLYTNAYL